MEERRRLSIVQISAEYAPDPGGVGDYTRLLSGALIARGHDVAILTGASRSGEARSAAQGDDPPLMVEGGDWSWRSLPPLLRSLTASRPDVVHIQYQTGAYGMRPAINLLPWLLRRRRERARIVVTAHDLRVPYLFPKAGPLRRWVTRRLLADADAAIVTNSQDREALAGIGRPDPEHFLAHTPISATTIPIGSNITPNPPAGYSREAWRRSLGVQYGEILLAYFGLANRTKGLLELVEAVARLPTSIRLLIVGGEAQSSLDRSYVTLVREAITRYGLGERVTISGYADPQSVSAHLLAADIGALPFIDGASYRRGSLLAMPAHGVPVVTTRPETPLDPPLVDGAQALLISPGSPDELTSAIEYLIEQPALRARLGASGQTLAKRFTWSAIAAAHEDVYNGLLLG